MNLYYELLQCPVFSMKEVCSLHSSDRTARTALEKLLKEHLAVKIRNGMYTCISGENGGPVANRFQIASAVNETSYVTHHTAFEYYGVADQVIYDVYVGSDQRFHDFVFDGYRYHFVKAQTQEGVISPQYSGGVKVTDKERTVVDSIRDMNQISGLEEVTACMLSFHDLNEIKLLNYLDVFGSTFLYQKTGFLVSVYQSELNISDEFVEACRKRIGNSKRYLTNGIAEPAYSKEWQIVYPGNMKSIKNGEYADAAI